MRRVERGWHFRFHLAAADHALDVVGGLRVIRDHLFGELLLLRSAFPLSELARLQFEHVAYRRFLDEIRSARRDTEDRVDARFLANRLRQSRGRKEDTAQCEE